MIDTIPFTDSAVAVLGLGRSGLAAARALMASDAHVWAWDDNAEVRACAAQSGVPLVDLEACDWKEPKALVLSPGIPHSFPKPHPVVNLARQAACEIVGEVELLARAQRQASYIGVTGTNGKSTTTALLGHILHSAGREAETGGNLGVPALELKPLGATGVYVLEMSSFQLELTPSLVLGVAALLNISSDHLDRHGSMEGYIAAKESIFRSQRASGVAVVGIDDAHCRAIFERLKAEGDRALIPISGSRRAPGGVYVIDGTLFDDIEGDAVSMLDLSGVHTLPGEHNWQNAAAAYAVAKAAGAAPGAIISAISDYPGLAHRQELVAVIDGVAYVNDSKATNPDAAVKALSCYHSIYWIAGGRLKEGGLEALEEGLGRVSHAFLIGEAMNAFAEAFKGKTPLTKSGKLETAVGQARRLALKEKLEDPVVLLAPACASFDQFANFEARGDAFRKLVTGRDAVMKTEARS